MRLRSSLASLDDAGPLGRAAGADAEFPAADAHSEVGGSSPRIVPLVPPGTGGGEALDEEALRGLHAALFGKAVRKAGVPAIVVLAAAGERSAISAALPMGLAVTSAALGYQVLLVDADFEGTGVSRYLLPDAGAEVNGAGVTGYLEAGGRGVLPAVRTSVERLGLLPAGRPVPNAHALIEHAGLASRLRAAGTQRDIILIDAGAQEPDVVAALGAGADGVAIIAERHKTALRDLDALTASLRNRDVTALGTVLV